MHTRSSIISNLSIDAARCSEFNTGILYTTIILKFLDDIFNHSRLRKLFHSIKFHCLNAISHCQQNTTMLSISSAEGKDDSEARKRCCWEHLSRNSHNFDIFCYLINSQKIDLVSKWLCVDVVIFVLYFDTTCWFVHWMVFRIEGPLCVVWAGWRLPIIIWICLLSSILISLLHIVPIISASLIIPW